MSQSRDPRKDPRPGDVLKDCVAVSLVVRVVNGRVWWAYEGQRSNELMDTTIEVWIRDSVNEEIIHVAD